MQMGTLGQVVDQTGGAPAPGTAPMRCYAPLPSSASVHSALRGEPGSWMKVAVSTSLRAVLISPGVAAAGARGWKLVGGSLLSSVSITLFIFLFYAAKRDGNYN